MIKKKVPILAEKRKKNPFLFNKFYTGGPAKLCGKLFKNKYTKREKEALKTIYSLFLGRKARKETAKKREQKELQVKEVKKFKKMFTKIS